MRKLVYFVACSADGFIAREDGAFDFFPMTGDHLPFLAALVRRLKQEPGLGIWLCGGAQLAGALYDEIDELVLKVNPVVIGTGIPLFRGTREARPLDLAEHQTFAGGVAIHRYRVRRTP
jgi:dihydrofolate reductase